MIFEVTSTLVLLIGAGLLIKSFWLVQQVNPGFNSNNLINLEISLPNTKYNEPAQIDGFFQSILTEIAALPGVKSAGYSSSIPMSNSNQIASSLTNFLLLFLAREAGDSIKPKAEPCVSRHQSREPTK